MDTCTVARSLHVNLCALTAKRSDISTSGFGASILPLDGLHIDNLIRRRLFSLVYMIF